MDTLSELIKLLNNNDKKDFLRFQQRKNKRKDVKNIQLFDLLETDDIKYIKNIYSSNKNNDAYHALRKRLQDNLLLFLSQKTFENSNSEAYEALRLLVVSRFLLENNLAKIAFKCLAKAEKIAIGLEQFSLLNEILLLRLQYAHLNAAEDLEELTARFLTNQTHLKREAKLHVAYAFLRQELQDIHLKGKVVDLTMLIGKTMKRYQIAIHDLMNYKSLYQILFIANEYADIHQNYRLIESYIRKGYQFIQDQGSTAVYHRFYHLSILYYLANFNLRNKSFTASKAYLAQMMQLMEEDQQYYKTFFFRHQLLSALNCYYSGESEQAIELLRRAINSTNKKTAQEEIDDLQLCLTMFLAQDNDTSCLRYLAKFTHSDAWYEKKLGMLWTIRKNLMEILIHAQFENIELATSRLTSFKRRYKKYLLTTREKRVIDFVALIEKYLLKPSIAFEKTFQINVLAMLDVEENRDIFNISFISWMIARWERQTPYQLTLNLLNFSYRTVS
ncbi:hypothetical protein RYH73_09130 [Olivibacter sp. CPCC 100613]|uniref:hypothetical protein n=1 Tax=Olivibacter sp. CPCC 100613 TaxID=3079931 RepID=UPI002FFD34EF